MRVLRSDDDGEVLDILAEHHRRVDIAVEDLSSYLLTYRDPATGETIHHRVDTVIQNQVRQTAEALGLLGPSSTDHDHDHDLEADGL